MLFYWDYPCINSTEACVALSWETLKYDPIAYPNVLQDCQTYQYDILATIGFSPGSK